MAQLKNKFGKGHTKLCLSAICILITFCFLFVPFRIYFEIGQAKIGTLAVFNKLYYENLLNLIQMEAIKALGNYGASDSEDSDSGINENALIKPGFQKILCIVIFQQNRIFQYFFKNSRMFGFSKLIKSITIYHFLDV